MRVLIIFAKRSRRAAIGVRGGGSAPPPLPFAFTKMFKLPNFPSERFVILKFLFFYLAFAVSVEIY